MLLYPFLFSSVLFQQFSSTPILILLSTISTILFYTHSYSPHYYFKNSPLCPLLFSSLLFHQFSFIPILILLTTISTILFYIHSYYPQYYFNNSLSYPFLFSSVLFQQFSLCAFFFHCYHHHYSTIEYLLCFSNTSSNTSSLHYHYITRLL